MPGDFSITLVSCAVKQAGKEIDMNKGDWFNKYIKGRITDDALPTSSSSTVYIMGNTLTPPQSAPPQKTSHTFFVDPLRSRCKSRFIVVTVLFLSGLFVSSFRSKRFACCFAE